MKFLVIAVKGLKEAIRDRKGMAFLLLFPVMFMFIFRVAFGWGMPENDTYTIAVIDADTGEGPWDETEPEWLARVNSAMEVNLSARQFLDLYVLDGNATAGVHFVESVLRGAKYDDGTTDLFEVREVGSYAEGEELVRKGDVAALVVIPANFTSAIQGAAAQAAVRELRAHSILVADPMPGYADALVDLTGVTGTVDYSFSSSMVMGHLGAYKEMTSARVRGAVGSIVSGEPAPFEGSVVRSEFVSRGDTSEFVVFDWIAPGIIVFGLMMVAMPVAGNLVMEVKERTLDRLRLTKMTALDMMAGTTVRWLFIGLFQTLLLFAAALGVGMHFAGDFATAIPLAIAIGMAVVLATIALALIISAFVDDPDQASGLGTLIVVPLSFFTDAFFQMDLAATRYLPWTQGATAMRQALLYNDVGDALTHTLVCLAGALVMFAIGVLLFHYKRLRRG